jgi:transcriptional regulator with XRE-family HTH domain
MGRGMRLQPKNLSTKLKQIRDCLGYTQQEMADRLKNSVPEASIHPGHISQFESGKREPQLPVLLAYAKLLRVSTDVLIDDALKIPVRPRRFPNK